MPLYGLICLKDYDGVPAGELYSSDHNIETWDDTKFERVVLDSADTDFSALRTKRWDKNAKALVDNPPPPNPAGVLLSKSSWDKADTDAALKLILERLYPPAVM